MVLPAIAAAAPALVAGAMNYFGARQANDENKRISQRQMDFQERMSNTAYQRATEDMRKAGINPILAYNQGGASTPGGSTAQMTNNVSGAVSSAVDVRRAAAELENMRAQNENLHAQNRQIESQTDLNRANETAVKTDTALDLLRVPRMQTESEIEKSWYGKGIRYAERLNDLPGISFLDRRSREVNHYHRRVN